MGRRGSITALVFWSTWYVLSACSDSTLRSSESNSSGEKPQTNDAVLPQQPAPTIQPSSAKKTIEIDPAAAVIFRGEEVEFQAYLVETGKDKRNIRREADWKAGDENVIDVGAGKAVGVDGGRSDVNVAYAGVSAKAVVSVIQCRQVNNSPTNATRIKVKGENWPGNNIDHGGADYDDYFVVITGKFVVENGYEIFATEDQTIQVQFSIGTTGSTSQTVKLKSVDCDGNPSADQDVSGTSGTTSIKARKGDRFDLWTTAKTGGTVRNFQLIRDHSYAYRLEYLQ